MNKAVADVGLFNTSKVNYSKDTQQVLKVLMDEARFTNLQRNNVNNCLRKGDPLPPSLNNKKVKPAKQPSKITHLNPKNYKGSRRSQTQILSAEPYLRDQYQPSTCQKYGGSYEREKTRLCSMMAYGQDLKALAQENKIKKQFWGDGHGGGSGGAGSVEKSVERDRFEEIQEEIEERQSFLDSMQPYGDAHKARIDSEISQLIREMELIDKKKCRESIKLQP